MDKNNICFYYNQTKIHDLKIPSGSYIPAFDMSSGSKFTLIIPKKFPDFL